ncbi:hypothetical protein C8R47DRAFT_1101918 [Mycena vitilis]|nr:hypothetical protein C8R47DRAFT_1101918 [Mycena vitilis]
MSFSFALAWDEDEGDVYSSAPGDAEFLTTLNPNAHISLLKRIHIVAGRTNFQRARADVREIAKHVVPFQVRILTALVQSRTRSVLYLDVANTTTSRSPTSQAPTLGDLRSDILKVFDDPGKSWSWVRDDEKQNYYPHITLRRGCKPDTVANEARLCSDAIRSHLGPFRSHLGLIIRGISMFKDTRFGPRFVEHFPFGYSSSYLARSRKHRKLHL